MTWRCGCELEPADFSVLTECPNKAWAISCPRMMVSWWTSATLSSIPVNMKTSPFYTKVNIIKTQTYTKNQSFIWKCCLYDFNCVINWSVCNFVFAVVLLTGRTKALTVGLWTTWTVQETSETSGMSLFLCARCCTTRSTTWWRTSVTGRSSSANSSMYWNTHTPELRHSKSYYFLSLSFLSFILLLYFTPFY